MSIVNIALGDNIVGVLDTWTYKIIISGTGNMYDFINNESRDGYNDIYYVNIETVIINDGVTSIGNYAFKGCSRLTSITIPSSVTSIGNSAFSGCNKLTEITIPENVTSIGNSAFWDCDALTNIVIPEGVTSIGNSTFGSCNALTSVVIPESVTSIGNSAFAYCRALTTIEIPSNVTSIGREAFCDCSALTTIIIPKGVTLIGFWTFKDCSALESIELPEGLISIGIMAFSGCKALKNITIPSSVKSIENSVFSGCDTLTSVVIPDSVTSIGNSLFSGCDALTNVVFPKDITSIGDYTFNGCSKLASITIPESVTAIGNRAFQSCTALTSITIPSGVTSIKYCTFYGCSALASIELKEGITSIGNYAFYGCKSLGDITTIPGSVTTIGAYAFSIAGGYGKVECSLKKHNTIIPGSVTSIGKDAFNRTIDPLQLKTVPDNLIELIQESSITILNPNCIIESSSTTLIDGKVEYDSNNTKTGIAEYTRIFGYNGSTAEEYANSYSEKTFISLGNAIESIQVTSMEIFMGETAKIDVELVPKDTVQTSVNYQSSHPNIVSVDDNGKICAWKEGTADITVASGDNPDVTATCTVTVLGIEPLRLPDGYKKLEYVQNDGTGGYFNTGVKPTSNTRVVFDGYVVSGDTAIYGSRYNNNDNRYAVQYISSDVYRLSYDTSESLVESIYAKGIRYTFDQQGGILYINGTQVAQVDAYPTYPNAQEIYALGALNTKGNATNLGIVRMYYLKIYQNDVLAKDFIAVQNPDGVIGLFERVEGVFVEKSGSGTIIGGPEIDGEKITAELVIKKLPNKLEYFWREELDLTGIAVVMSYSTGSELEVADYSVTGYDAFTIGTQIVTLTFDSYSTTFSVRVAEVSVSGIELITLPERLEYIQGQDLDLMGLSVLLVWTDGTTEVVTDYEVYGYDKDIVGVQEITVDYHTFKTTFSVTVIENIIIGIEITTLPAKLTYYIDEKIDLTGMIVTASLLDGTKSEITEWSVDEEPFTIGYNIITIRCGECYDTFEINVLAKYTVIFEDWDGNVLSTQIVKQGESAVSPEPGGRQGYTFIGWDNDFSVVISDITVKAQYTINIYTVEFVDWDGRILSEQHVEYQKSAAAPSAPSREGYTFTGWDKGFSLVESNLTVIAVYTKNPYIVTFVDWDLSIIAIVEVKEGEDAEAPTDPEREGFYFRGWDKAYTNVIENITITALYDRKAIVTLNPSQITVTVGKTETLEFILSPEELENKSVEWNVSDESIIKLSGDKIHALRKGRSIITVTHAEQKVSASCIVTVVGVAPASEAYKEAIRNNNRGVWDARVTLADGTVIEKDDISKIKLNELEFPDNKIAIGGVVSSYVEIIFRNKGIKFYNKNFVFEIGMQVGDTVEYIQFGRFYVTESDGGEDDETVEVMAYDLIKKTERSYVTGLTYPASIQAVTEEIAKMCDIPINADTVYPEKTLESPIVSETCREALKVIGQIMGANVVANRDCELEFRFMNLIDVEINANERYYKFKKPDTNAYIRSVLVVGESSVYSASGATALVDGEEQNAIDVVVNCTYGDQETADRIYSKIMSIGTVFRSGDLEFLGDPSLQVGDVITVKDVKGKSYQYPIMCNVLEYDGGVKNATSAYTETEEQREFTQPSGSGSGTGSGSSGTGGTGSGGSGTGGSGSGDYGTYTYISSTSTEQKVDRLYQEYLNNGKCMSGLRCISCTALPDNPDANTIYLIQGEVSVG